MGPLTASVISAAVSPKRNHGANRQPHVHRLTTGRHRVRRQRAPPLLLSAFATAHRRWRIGRRRHACSSRTLSRKPVGLVSCCGHATNRQPRGWLGATGLDARRHAARTATGTGAITTHRVRIAALSRSRPHGLDEALSAERVHRHRNVADRTADQGERAGDRLGGNPITRLSVSGSSLRR